MTIPRLFPLAAPAMLLLTAACASGPMIRDVPTVTVRPFTETAPVGSLDDAADDPAIWINLADPGQSRVLGTDKQSGLYFYNLRGEVVDFVAAGRVNNVDLRQNVPGPTAGGTRDLAAASNRSDNSVTLFEINGADGLSEIARFPAGADEPYGLCVGAIGGQYQVMVTYKTGRAEMWDLSGYLKINGAAETAPRLVGAASLPSQLEGCAIDDDNGVAFIGEENGGLWKLSLTGTDGLAIGTPQLLDAVGSETGLATDVEGVDIWHGANGTGYIVVSAQAADRYVVYDRAAPHAARGVFAVGALADANRTIIDAVSHTDGLAVTSANLGIGLPDGLLVVQDDSNTNPTGPQNFKLVDWREVEAALGLTAPVPVLP